MGKSNRDAQENTRKEDQSQNLDLLICFDSNWQYMNRRKLWKEKGSDLKRCGTLFEVSRVVKNSCVKELKYLLLHVGTNDLDNKDYLQVLDELKQLLKDARRRFPGVKFIISEMLPRNDARDEDVQCFNAMLKSHAERDDVTDITIATHHNMRDPTFTMFYDEKHLKRNSAPRFAKNLIRAMLFAYNIQSKSELYPENSVRKTVLQNNGSSYQKPQALMQKNLMSLAGYGQATRWNEWSPQTTVTTTTVTTTTVTTTTTT